MEALALPLLALIAGLVSFSSPCCIPLVPGYLSYMSALPASQLGDVEARRITVRASLLFVAGFTTVFTVFGVAVTLVGSVFLRNEDTVVRFFGVFIIVMGLSNMGVICIPALLLVLYSIGLGIPFVLLALGFSRAQRSLGWLRRNGRRIEVAGGTMLVGVGVLFVSGRWSSLFRPLQRYFAQLGWPPV